MASKNSETMLAELKEKQKNRKTNLQNNANAEKQKIVNAEKSYRKTFGLSLEQIKMFQELKSKYPYRTHNDVIFEEMLEMLYKEKSKS